MCWYSSDYIIRTVLPWKRVFRGFPDYVIRKHHVTRPIFWSFRITKSGKIRYSFFHPLTKENTILDYKIRKLKGIFEKNRAREETHRVRKVNPNLFSYLLYLGKPMHDFIHFDHTIHICILKKCLDVLLIPNSKWWHVRHMSGIVF